ncbi:MAG: hypothetical protein ACRBN8_20170 [Nannocystales bacterium]
MRSLGSGVVDGEWGVRRGELHAGIDGLSLERKHGGGDNRGVLLDWARDLLDLGSRRIEFVGYR